MKKAIIIIIIAVVSSITSVMTYIHLAEPTQQRVVYVHQEAAVRKVNSPLTRHLEDANIAKNVSFTNAARIVNPTVVHITTVPETTTDQGDTWPYEGYFNDPVEGWGAPDNYDKGSSGSGVIVSSDGYIVTNNHVVEGGGEIHVSLYDKKQHYIARIIGTDSNTDLALLKVNATKLPAVRYGDSDDVEVGQWVLAVGNPFNLTSTVTAGIVSAKARNIDILEDEYAIESFIQTDAAVNPGNSGGALVNIKGELIGINTAIATPSGTFTGYSFAVPVNIVQKVVDDLRQHGIVQRAYLGVNIKNIDSDLANRLKLPPNMKGIYIEHVIAGSAAYDAGLRKGDIITEINGYKINSSPELQEKMARFRPGDPIAVTFWRDSKQRFVELTLKNIRQNTKVIKSPEEEVVNMLGATFEELSAKELRDLGLRNGIRVKRLTKGLLQGNTAMRVGFIIIKMNNSPVRTVEEFYSYIRNIKSTDGVMLEGLYQGQRRKTLYAFSMP